MKDICVSILALLLIISCDKEPDQPVPASPSLIAGKWVEREAYISSGGPQYWVGVEDGEAIEFGENGTFTSSRYAECASGTYFLEGDQLMLLYHCDGFDPGQANENGFITYRLEFFSSYFILTPTSGPLCIEGCSYKYRRQ